VLGSTATSLSRCLDTRHGGPSRASTYASRGGHRGLILAAVGFTSYGPHGRYLLYFWVDGVKADERGTLCFTLIELDEDWPREMLSIRVIHDFARS
jgi:hypothetical protein